MKNIRVSDITLATYGADDKTAFTFREKIEVAKLLDRLSVSSVELGTVSGSTADNLLIKSVASAVKESSVAVCPGFDADTVKSVWEALKEAKHPRFQVCAAVSTARMEYVYHKKPDAMLKAAEKSIADCKAYCDDIEFIAEDATRADFDYLCKMIETVISAGATAVTVCDTAGKMLPDEFGEFIGNLVKRVPKLNDVILGVNCSDALNTANAAAVAAIRNGADEIKVTALPADAVSLSGISKLLSAKSDTLQVSSSVVTTEINRVLKGIERLCNKSSSQNSPFEDGVRTYPEDMTFNSGDTIDDIVKGAISLGYDLDDNDKMRIWKAFCKVASRKETVTVGELEAIIASEAMQVPPTYTLESYIVTTGNSIDILAHVKLRRNDECFDGMSLGDGPIDAAFLAIEKITGHHYELDDFQIQAISDGREAMGQSIVRLRSGGKIYSGRGVSTDIIGSGVAAYVNALNKIIYEEEQV